MDPWWIQDDEDPLLLEQYVGKALKERNGLADASSTLDRSGLIGAMFCDYRAF